MKNIQPKFILNLKRRIVQMCGFHILTKKDCRTLAELINSNTGEGISEATIYRLFLSKQGSHTFYLSTYGILAQFVGFRSWDDFCNHASRNEDTFGQSAEHAFPLADPTLLDQVVRHKAWPILKDYFDAYQKDVRFEGLHAIGWNIFLALQRNPTLEKKFYEIFADHPIVRQSFFELAADPDNELPQYGYGFELYIKAIKKSPLELRIRDHVFAHSLLIRKSFLEKNFDAVISRFEIFLSPKIEEEGIRKIQPAYPLARLFEAKWLYLYCKGEMSALKKHQNWWFEWTAKNWGQWDFTEKKAVFYCATEAALWTEKDNKFYTKMLQSQRAFILTIFSEKTTPSPKALLTRTEFNGVRLQRYLREGY